MNNIFKLFAIFFFVPFVVYGAKPNTGKQQKQAQMRNEQTINHLINLGRMYNRANNTEIKEKISTNIEREVDHWYMENIEGLVKINMEAKESEQHKQKMFVPMENDEQVKQQLVKEIKEGKIPEIMLKTLPEQTAQKLKQRMDSFDKPQGAGIPAQKGKGFRPDLRK